jgi:hypothetical protein
MITTQYEESDLDGRESGGFVVANVNARRRNAVQILDDTQNGGAYFTSLDAAREACEEFRARSGNEDIFVYALVGVEDAMRSRSRGSVSA